MLGSLSSRVAFLFEIYANKFLSSAFDWFLKLRTSFLSSSSDGQITTSTYLFILFDYISFPLKRRKFQICNLPDEKICIVIVISV